MKIRYTEEFRDKSAAGWYGKKIASLCPQKPVTLMEICGGHTLSAMKYGIRDFLPRRITLKSGPGCPVCVTPASYIDQAVMLLRKHDVIIASFGDMIRVPGSDSSLVKQRMEGRDVRICLSPLDALEICKKNPDREIVFLGIGFETTAPGIAVAIKKAVELGLGNFTVLTALKTMPPAMMALLEGKHSGIDGFILPGHVTAITGTGVYMPVVEKYPLPCVVSGFEPTDMLASIEMLARQIKENRSEIEIQYTRSVKPAGNTVARMVMDEVFSPVDAIWRGLGKIPGSGLAIRKAFEKHDAVKKYCLSEINTFEPAECRCGDVMKGEVLPEECSLFGKTCLPENPVGACMVSSEGSCGIHYRYQALRNS